MPIILRKMQVERSTSVKYSLPGEQELELELNSLLNKHITINHTGRLFCTQCDRPVKKLFQQGHCYPCFRRLQECNMCMLFPERCRVMEGCCPKDDWAHSFCHANHVIYLSFTSNIKVGITQEKNVPSRWIDQGAVAAVAVMRTSNRFLSGVVEVDLKANFADKTNWRAMLKASPEAPDLVQAWNEVLTEARPRLEKLIEQYGEEHISFVDAPQVETISYPVDCYPEKITSLSLDKTPTVAGKLVGIKGQYLYFEHGVMNVRKFGGYEVDILVE